MQTSASCRETRQSSESGHATAAKKTTGCMSGIFHLLLSRHSRKRLPSGKKTDKAILTPGRLVLMPEKSRHRSPDNNVPSRITEHSTTHVVTPAPAKTATPTSTVVELRRRSYETPRSPTIPPELRRPPGSPAADSPRRSPALVARLMGLDEMVLVQSPDSAAEKRRRLMGALEKCTEDLDALKRIIEAVQLAEAKRKPVAAAVPVVVVPNGNDTKLLDGGDAATSNGQQPSPVSVLHALSSPGDRSDRSIDSPVQSRIMEMPLPGSFLSGPCELLTARLNTAGGHDTKKTWSTGETRSFAHRIVIEELPRAPERKIYRSTEEFGFPRTMECGPRRWRGRRSRAMVEAVGEVCEDGVCEERWEFGRVGFELEAEIFGGLLDELVVEVVGCSHEFSIPLRRSRKRLYF